MRIRLAAALLAVMILLTAAACRGGGLLGKQYEYEEDLTLGIDGSATLVVNASLPSLAALRGLDVPTDSAARLDLDEIRALFETPVSDVTRVSRPWRRKGRRFVQIRMEIPDINRLSEAPPFAWSTYAFRPARPGELESPTRQGPEGAEGVHVYKQTVGPSALKPGTLKNYGWDGSEIVAFRLHLPSKILHHTARDLETHETSQASRGNILAWEQQLADRLDGQPVNIYVEMESQSILYRTLFLFGGAFAAAVLLLVLLIWWTMRRGRDQDQAGA
ncbi:MAG: hypothetical protein WEB50_12190 [Vicinamibacterales bacterium]